MTVQEILDRYGIGIETLVECGFSLLEGEVDKDSLPRLKERCGEMLRDNMKDQNVALLIEAAFHLDTVVANDSAGACESGDDPAALVADELIGMSIAEYIAGKRGLFNYVRYDRSKPGVLGSLPPFMDDALGALVAGTMTRLFEE